MNSEEGKIKARGGKLIRDFTPVTGCWKNENIKREKNGKWNDNKS